MRFIALTIFKCSQATRYITSESIRTTTSTTDAAGTKNRYTNEIVKKKQSSHCVCLTPYIGNDVAYLELSSTSMSRTMPRLTNFGRQAFPFRNKGLFLPSKPLACRANSSFTCITVQNSIILGTATRTLKKFGGNTRKLTSKYFYQILSMEWLWLLFTLIEIMFGLTLASCTSKSILGCVASVFHLYKLDDDGKSKSRPRGLIIHL